jgi:hypothetical protein
VAQRGVERAVDAGRQAVLEASVGVALTVSRG